MYIRLLLCAVLERSTMDRTTSVPLEISTSWRQRHALSQTPYSTTRSASLIAPSDPSANFSVHSTRKYTFTAK